MTNSHSGKGSIPWQMPVWPLWPGCHHAVIFMMLFTYLYNGAAIMQTKTKVMVLVCKIEDWSSHCMVLLLVRMCSAKPWKPMHAFRVFL